MDAIVDDFGELIQMAAQLAIKAAESQSPPVGRKEIEQIKSRLRVRLERCAEWIDQQ